MIILPREVYLSLAQQRHNDLKCLLKAAGKMIEGIAKCPILQFAPARPQPQDKAAIADLIQAISHLGEQGGVANGGASDERPKLDTAGDGGQSTQKGERLPAAFFLLIGERPDHMICHPQGIEANLLRRPRLRLEVAEARHVPALGSSVKSGRETN